MRAVCQMMSGEVRENGDRVSIMIKSKGLEMVVKMSLMNVYVDDAGATQRRFMAMEREDLF